ncbi:kinesin-domain-containing protein [Gonapodya prolifera JEL478]|uniref:Kinesin-domain-containing protein n=1 Tax=Gonapodya prolifera (strain JEL478) TaxID=1344416 RepID=A0A139AQ99_GONPJ|nr:kinesin-domain-containing protein [Gonapodya prolifera JEL478]|eukprot:KXS18834.1 kinesin-domain-containing protein [Gonapodya prolifera JEL478]
MVSPVPREVTTLFELLSNSRTGTIFAYGQTSSGKTYTMQGSHTQPGIIPLAIRDVFQHIVDVSHQLAKPNLFLLRVSYLEIYNEQIKDLFNPKNDNLKIHENPNRDIYVGDLTENIVCTPEAVSEWMLKGEGANRHVGETNMNERSSRSHTIFRMVRWEQQFDSRTSFSGAYKVSCLNLVDLAGSERVGHTGAEGIRLKEGGHINKSLLALGTVIGKLSDAAGTDRMHIPYRDSKLTRILQPSLGGNARTCIICTVNPTALYVEETLSTLKFATRAKTIRNRPEVNEDVSEQALLRKYRKEINALKSQLDEVRNFVFPLE